MTPLSAALPRVSRDFLPPREEAAAFDRLRRRILATLVRQLFARSRFRVSLVVSLTGLLWGGMFWITSDGFLFLRSTVVHADTYASAVSGLFAVFFAALMLMLAFSAGVILYGTLFRSREIAFLLTTPARAERVFLHKFHEAIVLSSWGFVLLGSPILLAYGVVSGAPWYYYAMLPPFLMAFIYIPVAIGAIVCLATVRYIPRRLGTALVFGVAVLVGCCVWMGWNVLAGPKHNLLTPGWLQEIVARLRISQNRLLPSWWLSAGLLDAADWVWDESLLFLTVMISNALLFRQAALWTAGRVYRNAYSGLLNKVRQRKRPHTPWFDRIVTRLLAWLPATLRLMAVKDLRIFRRDPLQWFQVLIFVFFLFVYFLSIPSFTYDISLTGWVNMVSFLNLAVVGLVLATFTTRFVFPLISLEGRRFWTLGLLGVRRETILWSKFLLAIGGTIIPCAGLVLLSDTMLRVTAAITLSHQLTCLVLCLGLSGIAVGLGAWLPNLREESPSRIAAGFGGTLTLVISTLFILVVVLLTALPAHFYFGAKYAGQVQVFAGYPHIAQWLRLWWIAGTIASVMLGAVATVVPLWIGFRVFRKLEF
jgi:ABC-2 type transport system permease protein